MLVNHPALRKKDRYGRQYRDYDFPKFYGDLSRLIARTGRRPEDLLSRCIPVLEAPLDHDLRRGIIEDLFGLGLTGVFPLQVMEAGRGPEKPRSGTVAWNCTTISWTTSGAGRERSATWNNSARPANCAPPARRPTAC